MTEPPQPPLPRGQGWGWLSLPLLVILWQGAAVWAQSRFLPGPLQVAEQAVHLATSGPLIADFGQTLARAAAAFVFAMIIGTLLGLALGRWKRADQIFGPWIVVGLNLPAIVVGFLCFIWMGLSDAALVLAVVVNKTPLVATTLRQGVRAMLPDYDEMAKAFRLSPMRRLRLILWPQLAPYALAAARTGLSLIWKIVLVFEMLGSDGGVGFRVALYFQMFNITAILAYTLVFVSIVLTLEHLVLHPLERRASAWRSAQM